MRGASYRLHPIRAERQSEHNQRSQPRLRLRCSGRAAIAVAANGHNQSDPSPIVPLKSLSDASRTRGPDHSRSRPSVSLQFSFVDKALSAVSRGLASALNDPPNAKAIRLVDGCTFLNNSRSNARFPYSSADASVLAFGRVRWTDRGSWNSPALNALRIVRNKRFRMLKSTDPESEADKTTIRRDFLKNLSKFSWPSVIIIGIGGLATVLWVAFLIALLWTLL